MWKRTLFLLVLPLTAALLSAAPGAASGKTERSLTIYNQEVEALNRLQEQRDKLQARVEKIHRNWKKDRDYLPPPGLEVGYVPVVTRQAAR